MTSEFEYIKLEYTSNTATIFLNRLDKKNALSIDMINELATAVENIQENPDVRLVIFRSISKEIPVFSAGIDLVDLTGELQTFDEDKAKDLITQLQSSYQTIRNCDLPTIAIIDGMCLGAGLELAIACDFRIATPKSQFALNETRFGIIPDLGGISYLSRIIGVQATKRLVLLAESINADMAYDWGMIDWLVDDPDQRITEIKNSLFTTSTAATIEAKILINSSSDHKITEALQNDAKVQLKLFQSGEPLELTKKFMSSRSK